MKTRRFGTLLTTLLLAALWGSACERTDPAAESGGDRMIQGREIPSGANIGPGPGTACDCDDIMCRNVGVTGFPVDGAQQVKDESYHFKVRVIKTSDCPAATLTNNSCQFKRDQLTVQFPADPDLLNYVQLEHFARIDAYKPDTDQPLNLYEGPNTSALVVYESADIYFRWADDQSGRPTPELSEVETGGICIIGIITDPRFPTPGNGGLRPIRPTRPHLL